MIFIVMRTLRQSEVGWFGEVRRQGRETSRQRALNFDATEVERMFPAASRGDIIPIHLHRRSDSGELAQQPQALRRQEKNWRLTGDKIDDRRFGVVAPGDLVVMAWDVGDAGAVGAFDILAGTDARALRILAHPHSGGLVTRGLLAVPAADAPGLVRELRTLDGELFAPYLPRLGDEAQIAKTRDGDEAVEGELILPPSPARMFQVIASMGHTLNVAVADIVDNSITAGASTIKVAFQRPDRRESSELFASNGPRFPGGCVAFTDDGRGMDRATLLEAMKFGSNRDYGERDLGRYGIGLKAASFSQARCLTVASRSAGSSVTVLRWDQDHIERTGRWEVVEPALDAAEREVLLAPLAERAGTVVLWTRLRPLKAAERRGRRAEGADTAYERAIGDLVLHVGMVFHRFLSGETRSKRQVSISLNGQSVPPWDPFLRHHAETQRSGAFSELVPCPGTDREYPVTVDAWILPHTKRLPESDVERAGQNGRWNELQGFYIYRADRIIQAGGWCELWNREEHKKLLRVALSFDPELDAAFDVHAAKMSVSLPMPLAEVLQQRLQDARKDADARYRKDGKEEKPAPVKVVGSGGSTGTKPTTPTPPPVAPTPPPSAPTPPPLATPPLPPKVVPVNVATVSPVPPAPPPPLTVAEPKPLPDQLELKDNLDSDLWRMHTPMFGPKQVLANASHTELRPLLDAIRNLPNARLALARLIAATEEGIMASGGDAEAFRRYLRNRLKNEAEQ